MKLQGNLKWFIQFIFAFMFQIDLWVFFNSQLLIPQNLKKVDNSVCDIFMRDKNKFYIIDYQYEMRIIGIRYLNKIRKKY